MAGECGGGPVTVRAASRGDGTDANAVGIGNDLNRLAHWANTHEPAAEAVTLIAHLVSYEQLLLAAIVTTAVHKRCTVRKGYFCGHCSANATVTIRRAQELGSDVEGVPGGDDG